jgi:hypothetical protein
MKTSANILNNLFEYASLLKSIKSIALTLEKQHGNPDVVMIQTASIAYDTVTLLLHRKDLNDKFGTLYFKCEFQITDGHGHYEEFYCASRQAEIELKKFIHDTVPAFGFLWNNTSDKGSFTDEVINYLAISDRIAQQGYLCTSGDNYRPGYFSEIMIQDEAITLKQINWHNARSIDHKHDYHMRELEIIIPFDQPYKESKFLDHKIGNMMILFSDRSSQKNKTCGDKILQKIEEEKLSFGFNSNH